MSNLPNDILLPQIPRRRLELRTPQTILKAWIEEVVRVGDSAYSHKAMGIGLTSLSRLDTPARPQLPAVAFLNLVWASWGHTPYCSQDKALRTLKLGIETPGMIRTTTLSNAAQRSLYAS